MTKSGLPRLALLGLAVVAMIAVAIPAATPSGTGAA
jgi:hypothetical protein